MKKQLFSDIHIGLYQQRVASELYDKVLRMNETELAEAESGNLAKSSRLAALTLDWDSLVSLGQKERRSSVYDLMFGEDEELVEVVYSFELPYEGSEILFSLQPSESRQLTLEPSVNSHAIVFEIVGSDKTRLERIKDFLNQNVNALNNELGAFNQAIEVAVKQAVAIRKEQLKKNNEGLAAFGVPLKEE
jgi:hypothetical protein